MLYRKKNKQLFEDNPRIVEFGGKDTQYQFIDRIRDVPNRDKLLKKAVDIIGDGGEKEWANLPTLLQAFYKIVQKPVEDKYIEKLIRKAAEHNNLPAFIKCLHMVDRTGLSLKNENTLEALLLAIRRRATHDEFRKAATLAALKYGSEIADLLETEQHGTGRVLGLDDPRTRPQVIALFLELAAVNAENHGGKDDTGVVKSYAKKLMGRIKEQPDSVEVRVFPTYTIQQCRSTRSTNGSPLQLSEIQLQPVGQQRQFLFAVSLWHGLQLASKILGQDMPHAEIAKSTVQQYRSVLDRAGKGLNARSPKPGSFDQNAIDDWNLAKQSLKETETKNLEI
jgi:hypothetical protein